MADRFWVFTYFDEQQINSPEDIDRILSDANSYREFRRAASAAPLSDPARLTDRAALIAGRGLDFSGTGDCLRRYCIASQAETLLRRAWHYFDALVVNDLSQNIASISSKKINKEIIAGWLTALLLVRQSRAESLIHVVRKDLLCKKCGRAHADKVFHTHDDVPVADDFAAAISRASTVEMLPSSSKTHQRARLDVPDFNIMYTIERAKTWFAKKGEEKIKRAAIQAMVDDSIHSVSTDVYISNFSQATLASNSPIEDFFLRYAASPQGDLDNQIAFDIELPIIENVPIAVLYKIREDSGDEFNVYKAKIRQAIHERIKTVQDPHPDALAKEIYDDVIAPPLMQLRSKMDRNLTSIVRDFSGAAVGTALGVAGLLVSAPTVSAAGFALATALSVAGLNAYKERDDLSAADMFLLYNAGQHSDKH